MNYTPNYHLPQWQESDRVLMTDFNAAMANLDTGLRLRSETTLALARDSYRQTVGLAVAQGHGQPTEALWVNSLVRAADAGYAYGWNGRYGLLLGGGELPTEAHIKATAQEVSYISTVPTYQYQSRKAAVTFTSNGYGTLAKVATWFWMNDLYGNQQEFTFYVTLTRTDVDEVVGRAGPFLSDIYSRPQLAVNFPLVDGVPYRMEFDIPAEHTNFIGRAGFLLAATQQTDNSVPHVTITEPQRDTTLTKTVAAPDYATAIQGLARWQGAGSVALSLNGQPMTVVQTRTTTNADGDPCQETEFSAPTPSGENLTVTLTITVDGEMNVYDYGLIWQ